MRAYDNYDRISYIKNCSLIGNGEFSFSLIDLDITTLDISGLNVINNTNILFFSIIAQLYLINSTIFNHSCESLDGCIFGLSYSILNVTNCSFINVKNNKNSGNVMIVSSQASFQRISMLNSSSSGDVGAFVIGYSSKIEIFESHFLNYSKNCILMTEGQIILNNSVFSNILRKNAKIDVLGVISCKNTYLSLISCYFEYNTNIIYISSVSLMMNNLSYEQVVIINCTFSYNQALNGGAVYLFNAKSRISNCIFTNNYALKGGAIFLDDSSILDILF